MAEKDKKSFLLYNDQKEIVDKLNDRQAGKLFKSIFEYVENGIIPKLDTTLDIAFAFFKASIDRADEKWQDIKKKRSEAGKKHTGNQYTRTKKMEQMEQNGTNGTVSVSDSVSVSVSDSVSVINNILHTPPTLAEIVSYGNERNIKSSYCERFFDYYESINWQGVKNWKNKFNYWVSKEKDKNEIYETSGLRRLD